MVTQTANYGWDKPDPGGDKDIWGTLQNGALDGVDTQVKVNEDAATQNASDVGDNAAAIVVNADAITALAAIVDQLFPPIGEILITADATNPAARYPGTTWVALEGVVLVGVGTSPSADGKVWALNDQEGNETHVITNAESAIHSHGAGSLTADPGSANSNTQTGGSGNRLTGTGTGNPGPVTGNTGNSGSGGAHNNLQPSLAKHFWERTA